MNKKLIINILLFLIGYTPLYALDFFGIEIGGSLDEMTERLKGYGYEVVMFVPQKGPDAGKKIVFGNDRFRALKKLENGEPAAITIFMGDSEVNMVTLECRSAKTKEAIQNFYSGILSDLLVRYKEPIIDFNKEKASPVEFEFLKSLSPDKPLPDLMKYWETSDGTIEASIFYAEPSLIINFCIIK